MLQAQSVRELNLWETRHEFAEKSSKIVPLDAPPSSNKNACFRRVTWKRVSVDVLLATSRQPLPQADYEIKLCF